MILSMVTSQPGERNHDQVEEVADHELWPVAGVGEEGPRGPGDQLATGNQCWRDVRVSAGPGVGEKEREGGSESRS